MTITTGIEAFIREHREHCRLTGDATEPTSSGYEVRIACLVA